MRMQDVDSVTRARKCDESNGTDGTRDQEVRLKKAAKEDEDEDEDEKEDGMNYLCRVWESARAGGGLDSGRLGLDADV